MSSCLVSDSKWTIRVRFIVYGHIPVKVFTYLVTFCFIRLILQLTLVLLTLFFISQFCLRLHRFHFYFCCCSSSWALSCPSCSCSWVLCCLCRSWRFINILSFFFSSSSFINSHHPFCWLLTSYALEIRFFYNLRRPHGGLGVLELLPYIFYSPL